MTPNQLRALYRDTGPGTFASLGELAAALVREAMTGEDDPRFYAATGSGGQFPSDGGYLVNTEIFGPLWGKVVAAGKILGRVTQQPVTGSALKVPAIDETARTDGQRQGGIRSWWVNEATPVTASAPRFRQVELALRKLMVTCHATSELHQDAAGLGAWLERALINELVFAVEAAIVAGAGTDRPLGIVGAPATIVEAAEGGQGAGTVVTANVKKMLARSWVGSRQNLVWLIHPDLKDDLLSLEATAGGAPLFHYADDGPRLLGRPVIPVEYCRAPGSVGDIILCDISQYLLAAKPANVSSSMHLRFLYDEMAFRCTLRVDGQPLWHTPITPYKGSTTQSAFVALAARP